MVRFEFKSGVWDKKDVVSNAFTIIIGCMILALVCLAVFRWLWFGVIFQVFALGILFIISLSWKMKKNNGDVNG